MGMVRFKNRYLVIHISFEEGKLENFNAHFVCAIIRDSIELNFGDEGYASIIPSLSVKYYNPLTGLGIVRVGRDHFRKAWLAITWIGDIKKQFCCIRTLHVGGTIKSCQKFAINYDKQEIRKLYSKDAKCRELLEQSMQTISKIEI